VAGHATLAIANLARHATLAIANVPFLATLANAIIYIYIYIFVSTYYLTGYSMLHAENKYLAIKYLLIIVVLITY
jgi:hypothetical protein